MYCHNCNTEFFSQNSLCPNCGKRGYKTLKGKKGLEFRTIAKWGAIILAVFFLIGILVSHNVNKKKENNSLLTHDINEN